MHYARLTSVLFYSTTKLNGNHKWMLMILMIFDPNPGGDDQTSIAVLIDYPADVITNFGVHAA